MTWADFEEKEYEIAFAIELATAGSQSSAIFPCGQVLEKVLGYDAATDPHRHHPIWRLLRIRRPAGLRLLPTHWIGGPRPAASQLPGAFVSLILQYKRPEYLYGARAKQWKHWSAPYFRFNIYGGQQRVLKRLERGLGGDAIVRYAAPAFWQRGHLEAAMLGREILSRSGFVSPLELAGHGVWTYQRPGTRGHANPQPRRYGFATFEDLLAEGLTRGAAGAQDTVRRGDSEAHLRQLGALVRESSPRLRSVVDSWVREVEGADLGLSPTQIELVRDYAATVTLLGPNRRLVASHRPAGIGPPRCLVSARAKPRASVTCVTSRFPGRLWYVGGAACRPNPLSDPALLGPTREHDRSIIALGVRATSVAAKPQRQPNKRTRLASRRRVRRGTDT